MHKNTKIESFLAWLWKKTLGEDIIANRKLFNSLSSMNEEHCIFLDQLENSHPEIKNIIKNHQEKRLIACTYQEINMTRKGVKKSIESLLAWLWKKLLEENPSAIRGHVQTLIKLNTEHYIFFEELKNNYPELKFIIQSQENRMLRKTIKEARNNYATT